MGSLNEPFNLLDLERHEEVLQEQERLYFESLHDRCFHFFVCPEGVSIKKHFQETLQNILKSIKKRNKVNFSEDVFLKVAQGKIVDVLEKEHNLSALEQKWLWAIHYCYHGPEKFENTVIKMFTLYRMLTFFSQLKDYASIEKLFNEHKASIIQYWPKFQNYLVFYAAFGHLQKVKYLFRRHYLYVEKIPDEAIFLSGVNKQLHIVDFFIGECTPEEKSKVFFWAAIYQNEEMIELLSERLSVKEKALSFVMAIVNQQKEAEKAKEKALLFVMTTDNKQKEAEKAIEFFINTFSSEEKGWALFFAVRDAHKKISEFFLEHFSEKEKGWALFLSACHKYKKTIIRSDEPLPIEKKWVLFLAEHGECQEAVEFLKNQLSVKEKGWAIFLAAKNKHPEIMVFFFQQLSTQDKEYALLLAKRYKSVRVERLLKDDLLSDSSSKTQAIALSHSVFFSRSFSDIQNDPDPSPVAAISSEAESETEAESGSEQDFRLKATI